MTTQQLSVPAPAPARTYIESHDTCRTCDTPTVGLSQRNRRCPVCADRKSLEREALALVAGGCVAISLGVALLAFLATQLV
jgi:hypothetical protein